MKFRKHSLRGAAALALSIALAVAGALTATAQQADGDPSGLPVRAIFVEGNVEIDTETILEQVQATQVGEAFEVEKVQEDLNRIGELGYFDAVEAEFFEYLDGVAVVVWVREFPVIESIEVTVRDDVVAPDLVKPLLGVEEGEVFNVNAFTQAVREIASTETYGYLLQPVDAGLAGQRGEVLQVEFAPLRVGRVLVEGLEKTREHVVLRELTFAPGEILSTDELRVSLNKLGQLGFFEPIIPEFLATDDPLVVDILLPITEMKTGRAAFGGGYSTADGLLGYIEVSDRNFLGRGEEVNIRWQFGQKSNTYDLGFTEPYLFGTRTSAGINLYNRVSQREEYAGGKIYPYEERRVGGNVSLGRPLGDYTRGFLTLRVENFSVAPDDPENSVVEPEDERTRSIIAHLRTDTTDHLFYPTMGARYDLSAEIAGEFFGGTSRFAKYIASASRFVKVGRNNQTLAFRVMTGVGTGDLPFAETFRVGGAETVRGYRYGEMRGDRMLVAQAEYRFPINNAIHGVVFADAGNAWSGSAPNLSELKSGVGVGIRFNTPLGVIRLDYGYNLDEKIGRAYFSFGPSF